MELLNHGITLEIPVGCFPLSTDSMVLSDFVKLPASAKVLDLGAGCGTLGLLLCAKDDGCTVTGIELDPLAHNAAEANIARNQLSSRLKSICGDLRTVPAEFVSGSFDTVLSNPPYFSGGPKSSRFSAARAEETCTLSDLLKTAAKAVKYGGDVYLVHRPERLAEIIALSAPHRLEAKRLLLLRHAQDSPVSLIFLQLRKGGKPGLVITEDFLYDRQNSPSLLYQKLYHTAGAPEISAPTAEP